jgi:hypothetical protein
MEREILNLQILQRLSSINSPEQTLRMLSPAVATDPQRTLDEIVLTAENGTLRTPSGEAIISYRVRNLIMPMLDFTSIF